ncbi:chondroitinase family polysaccharide lyase [Rubellicoccus peritrichatus]|uniref:Chondroitinase family polysaccharide lyase n=1 Tax=Rubellicoccus peritrichatus TaxID=3080537 RepID=A0AAQ3L921_9BACT|nr:chondroitinase family polysaccharide lyase [Puniceicoccus sp. CR14]WOO41331.1 chondroitinase family polysaccharide lyase [Puniceicoccus sp. CR14]
MPLQIYRILLIALGAVTLTLLSFAGAISQTDKIMESFENGIPEGLDATGSLTLDNQRMKHGEQSLRWDWRGNDRLTFDTRIGYRKQRLLTEQDTGLEHTDSATGKVYEPPRGFFVWIYNDQPRQQRIRIEFGREDEVDCWFDYNLDFKGWRTIAVNYDRGNMMGVPREDMTRMTINAPNTGSGIFFFDVLGLSIPMNARTIGPNPQLPHIDPHARLVTQYEHNLLPASQLTPTYPIEALDAQTIADFRRLEEQAAPYWLSESEQAKWSESKMEAIEKRYAEFGIVREGDQIFGRPLVKDNVMFEYFVELELSREEAMEGLMSWRYDFGDVLLSIARAWHYTTSAQIKARLEEMFINLFDYGVDQGFDYGAGLGWIHHYSYEIREVAPAMFLMRDPLQRHGRLDKAIEVCKWFHAFNQVYRTDMAYGWEGRKACDADDMQGLLTSRLLCAMMMPDSPEKARDIKHFSSYFSDVATAYANALDETFKPDGTVFHHAGHAYGYGGRGIYGSARTYDILKDTQFEASEDSRKRIAKVAQTYYDGLFTEERMTSKAFASIRFSNYKSADSFKSMLEMVGESYEPLDGFRMLPYTCVGLKRQKNDWMITARAHSKYVYPFESWGKSFFAFPLFIANGYLDVSYPDSLDSLSPSMGKAIWYDGIDWCRWPGATTVRLPYDQLATRVGQVRDEGGEYLFSDQAFSGGVETSYGCGIQVFQFKGHDKYGLESFTGKKSWFFVGNKVVCLGSDIRSDIAEYPVETTLFQCSLTAKDDPITVNGEEIVQFPHEQLLKAEKPQWIIDNRGTGYYVPNGDVYLNRIEQTNPDPQHQGEVSGDFVSAWFDHGNAPKGAEYEYVLIADASEAEMKAFAEEPTIEILQHDSTAHVVALNEEDATAYAVYSEHGASFDKGAVSAVDKQSTFIVKEEGNQLRLSVADPDLNIYDGQEDLLPDGTRTELSIYEREWFFWPSRPNLVRITLKGDWQIAELTQPMETAEHQPKVIAAENGFTVIEFECRDGLSAEVLLNRS